MPGWKRAVFDDPAISAACRHPFRLASNRFRRDLDAARHSLEPFRINFAARLSKRQERAVNRRKEDFFGIFVFDFVKATYAALIAEQFPFFVAENLGQLHPSPSSSVPVPGAWLRRSTEARRLSAASNSSGFFIVRI